MGSFACSILGYRVNAATNTGPSSFESINTVTGEVTLIKSNIGLQVNAIGYNTLDNYIYGLWDDGTNYHMIRIGSQGETTDLGAFLSSAGPGVNMGSFDTNGYFYIKQASRGFYYTIDMRPGSANYLGFVNPQAGFAPVAPGTSSPITNNVNTNGDWTYNPVDGELYCANDANTTLLKINPLTGVLTTLSITPTTLPLQYGGIFSDRNGFIYGIDNASGRIIRWQSTSPTSMTGVQFSQSTPSERTDATSCVLSSIELDFGDCPDTSSGNGPGNYSTLLENNGPRHLIDEKVIFGTGITAENDAKQNITATGDQDDGISTPIVIVRGSESVDIPISYTNKTDKNATIYGWIDFNNDGVFQLNEFASTMVQSSTSNPRTTTLKIPIPSNFNLSDGTNTFARFRITTDGLSNLSGGLTQEDTRSLGPASNGEVEDYIVSVATLTISGFVFRDLDCNGIFQAPDTGYAGIVVELYKVDNPSVPYRTEITDSSGNYSFGEVPQGKYFVKVILPNNSKFTLPNVSGTPLPTSNVNQTTGVSSVIDLNISNPSAIVNAGICGCLNLYGKTFYDCNGNGILDDSEAALPNIFVALFETTNNRQVGCVKTDCNGEFEFKCLRPDNYNVVFFTPSLMTITTQQASQFYGSKPLPNTGIVSVTSSNYNNLFAGFTGGTALQMRYCNSCVSFNNCGSGSSSCGCGGNSSSSCGCGGSCSSSKCSSAKVCTCDSCNDNCSKCKSNLCQGRCNKYLC